MTSQRLPNPILTNRYFTDTSAAGLAPAPCNTRSMFAMAIASVDLNWTVFVPGFTSASDTGTAIVFSPHNTKPFWV